MVDTGIELAICLDEGATTISDIYYALTNSLTGTNTPLCYDKLRPQLIKRAKAAKDMERINYMKADAMVANSYLDKLIQNIKRVQSGDPKVLKNYKKIKQWVDSGLTIDMVQQHKKFLKGEYTDALNARAKELKEVCGSKTVNETVSKREMFYRLSESEMFQTANRMAKINGNAVVDVLPRMAVEGEGFTHISFSDLDPTVIYELFESNRFRITCKKAMRALINSGKVIMVYGDTYRIPTCIPYLVANAGNKTIVYVNITPFTGVNKYGKIVVNQIRNYSGLMAVLFAACVAHEISEKTRTLPVELLDALVLFYSGMLTKVINGLVHADSIQKETCRYLCAEFALVQMYGTEYGTTLFQRIKNKYFPKLGNLIVNSIDDSFRLDGFDNMTNFIEEMKRNYPIMKVLNTGVISERWMKSFGSATALSLDYIGYHLYTLCMLLFESPLVSRMALEPLIDQKKGSEAFKRMQTMIEA